MHDLDQLSEMMLTDARRARFRTVVAQRLSAFTLVLENLGDPHNISACLRSAEAFGVQHVHVVALTGNFKAHEGISMYADRWLTVHTYRDTAGALAALAADSMTSLATVPPGPGTQAFTAVPLPPRAALWLGNEHDGLTPECLAACAAQLTIPMVGFTESLNVSTATAVLTQHFAAAYRAQQGPAALLPAAEQDALCRAWCAREVKAKLRQK